MEYSLARAENSSPFFALFINFVAKTIAVVESSEDGSFFQETYVIDLNPLCE